MSQHRYQQFLHRFLGYYEPLEAKMLALPYWDTLGFDYAERYKTPRLLQDLRVLGETPESIEALARCPSLPTLTTQSQLLGCLYVIEGATLGGQIITRHLLANLGLRPSTGTSFFDGYGGQTGSRWKAFCAMLSASGTESHDEIVASANQTFETLGNWLFPDVPLSKGSTP
ncbi:MAG: biliverdin-producing heme oxygenase [Polaromonas sp.]|nr:biliverdin-producing heme oxygenase [Polaromonas sp.]